MTKAMFEAPKPELPKPRCGKWSGLVALGAKLRAHPHPDQAELFPAPEPWGFQLRGREWRLFDPEDVKTTTKEAAKWTHAVLG